MSNKAIEYFDNIIMPMIHKHNPKILEEASIMLLGSVGLGIDDEMSDMESVIYLPNPIWKEDGSSLQLALNKCVSETNLWRQEGSIISVNSLSWLLDGQGEKILADDKIVLWEELSIEALFEIQENTIYYDPHKRLNNVRQITKANNMPEFLWKKKLLQELKEFFENGYNDYKKAIIRKNRLTEAPIHLGRAIEMLFRIGFYACHQYFPWRTHLRWAFNKLPLSHLGSYFDLLSSTVNWQEKMDIIVKLFNRYRDYIISNNLLPEVDLHKIDLFTYGFHEELIWAERLKAWENPSWRDYINKYKEKAVENGYNEDQFWVFSLWS